MDHVTELGQLVTTYFEALHHHSVLHRYWSALSLVLKGSYARGDADQYSDLDFVLVTDAPNFSAIVADYRAAGLSHREDGLFLPLGDWAGHYNLMTFNQLQAALTPGTTASLWEYTNVKILHDPHQRYARAKAQAMTDFQQELPNLLQQEYLTMRLQLDWLRQPLRRADRRAAVLYATSFWRAACRLILLLHETPFPPDKWLFRYLQKLDATPLITAALTYDETFTTLPTMPADLELADYPVYAAGLALTEQLITALQQRFPEAEWLDQWYLYA